MHLAAAAPEAICRYYERGLLRAECDYEASLPPHLKQIAGPMDDEGYVQVCKESGLGIAYDWDYINDNVIN